VLRRNKKNVFFQKGKKEVAAGYFAGHRFYFSCSWPGAMAPKTAEVFNPLEISLPAAVTDSGIFKEVLKVTLPGFSAVAAGEPVTSMEVLNSTLLALVDINPLDPKTFLSTQISGMRSLPLVVYVTAVSGYTTDLPPDSYPALLPSNGKPYLGGDLNGVYFNLSCPYNGEFCAFFR
jgi:hypothetical protein